MSKSNVSKIVDGLLEGQELSQLLTNPNKVSLIGKTIEGCTCPSCQEKNTMVVTSVVDEDQDFYTVVAKCTSCDEPTELELVIKEGTVLTADEDALVFEGRTFMPCNEGLMNGNYLKFNSGTRGYIFKNEAGDNIISFEQPSDEVDYKPLNTRVTFKVISFRNGMAKLISMVNDNSGKFPAGTLFYSDKSELQRQAKVSQPKQNSAMAGRFKY